MSDALRRMFELLGGLEERAQQVLKLRFGLDGSTPKTLYDIGFQLGSTPVRVRQIERDALAEPRDLLDTD